MKIGCEGENGQNPISCKDCPDEYNEVNCAKFRFKYNHTIVEE